MKQKNYNRFRFKDNFPSLNKCNIIVDKVEDAIGYDLEDIEENCLDKSKVIERLDYWENSRGAYILPQNYRNELRDFILTGKVKGLCDIEEIKKELIQERKDLDLGEK
jgi:hypothetical protein